LSVNILKLTAGFAQHPGLAAVLIF